jgi:hypothetical protein
MMSMTPSPSDSIWSSPGIRPGECLRHILKGVDFGRTYAGIILPQQKNSQNDHHSVCSKTQQSILHPRGLLALIFCQLRRGDIPPPTAVTRTSRNVTLDAMLHFHIYSLVEDSESLGRRRPDSVPARKHRSTPVALTGMQSKGLCWMLTPSCPTRNALTTGDPIRCELTGW